MLPFMSPLSPYFVLRNRADGRADGRATESIRKRAQYRSRWMVKGTQDSSVGELLHRKQSKVMS